MYDFTDHFYVYVFVRVLILSIGWTIWHGYDNGDNDIGVGCAPWGTALRASKIFDMAGDANSIVQESFRQGRLVLTRIARFGGPLKNIIFIKSEDVLTLEDSLRNISRAVVVTYLRAALHSASMMDESIENGQPGNMRTNQVAAITFFNTVGPIMKDVHQRATDVIATTLHDATGERPVMPVVEPAMNELLAAYGIDAEIQFGRLLNEE